MERKLTVKTVLNEITKTKVYLVNDDVHVPQIYSSVSLSYFPYDFVIFVPCEVKELSGIQCETTLN